VREHLFLESSLLKNFRFLADCLGEVLFNNAEFLWRLVEFKGKKTMNLRID